MNKTTKELIDGYVSGWYWMKLNGKDDEAIPRYIDSGWVFYSSNDYYMGTPLLPLTDDIYNPARWLEMIPPTF